MLKTKDGVTIKKRNLYYLITYNEWNITFWGQVKCMSVYKDEYVIFSDGRHAYHISKWDPAALIFKKFEKAKKALKRKSKELISTYEKRIEALNDIVDCTERQLREGRQQKEELYRKISRETRKD